MFNVYITKFGPSLCCVSRTFVPRFLCLVQMYFSLVVFSIVIIVKAIK